MHEYYLTMTNEITIIKASEQQANEKSLEVCLREEAVREQSKSARELFTSLQTELDELEGDLKDGLSYLDMKNDTLLSYMIDLCNIVLIKVRGETISGHASVERTVQYRVILEKIKAIDQRLAYQLNKVITMPEGADENDQGVNVKNLDIDIGSGDENEDTDNDEEEDQSETRAASSKAHATKRRDTDADQYDDDDGEDDEDSEFDGSVDEEDDDEEQNDNEIDDSLDELDDEKDEPKLSKAKSKMLPKSKTAETKRPVEVYKPPKLRSVAYSDDREGKSARRRRDYSEIYQDDDGNQDIVDESYVERDDERTRYEEENYTRLPDMNPKKAKRKLKAKEMASKGKKRFKGGGGGKGKGRKKGGKW